MNEKDFLKETTPIKITQDALDKANYISKRVCEIHKFPLESSFYLLNGEEKNEFVIRDIYLAKNQEVTGSKCNITPNGTKISLKEIKEMNRRVIGWGHSHANMGNFYSLEDDRTIKNLLGIFSNRKKINCFEKVDENHPVKIKVNSEENVLEIIIGQKKYFASGDLISDHSKNYLDLCQLNLFERKKEDLEFFYGMTFNAKKDEPHCVVAYFENNLPKNTSENVGYEVVPTNSEICLDENVLDQEIVSRIKNLQNHYSLQKKSISGKRILRERQEVLDEIIKNE